MSNNWWFVFNSNGFRHEPRIAKSDQSEHGCVILCECYSLGITDNHEISVQNSASFDYCGLLTGKLCLWYTAFSAQTYLSSSIAPESLDIRNRWNEFFNTIVTFCYHTGIKYHRKLHLTSAKINECLQQWLIFIFASDICLFKAVH